MTFGSAPPDLLEGARNAVETCLAIKRGERVALIADEGSAAVAASLEVALSDAGAIATCLAIDQWTPRPMTSAPGEVLAALETADAGILCV